MMKEEMLIARAITLRKLLNAAGLLLSYLFSRITRNPRAYFLPFSIAIEPTTSCNLRCPECPSGLRSFTRPTGMLDESLFQKIIDEQHNHLIYLIFYFQGEPYLHKQFLSMVKYCKAKGIYTATSTNGHYLDDRLARETVESGLGRLIISLDGTTQETYSAYRVGGKLDKVLEGTKNVVAWKQKLKSKTPWIIFQYLVVKPNEHQLEEARKLAADLGVDEIRFKTAQIYDYEKGSPLIPDNKKYSRYVLQQDGTYAIKNRLLNHCWKMWSSCVITWDGRVVPCCFDKDAGHAMGTLNGTNFSEVWNGASYRAFRSALFRSRKEIDICSNCSEGTRVFT